MRSPSLQALLIALMVMTVLIAISIRLERQQLSQSAALGELIDVSGRQRMLSQRITKNLHKLHQLERPDERAELLQEQLRSDLELFNQQHTNLIKQFAQGHSAARGRGVGSPSVLLHQMTPLLNEITRLTKTLLLEQEGIGNAFDQLARQEALLVSQIDQFNRLIIAEKTVAGNSGQQQHYLLGYLLLLLVGGALFGVSWCVLKQLHESRLLVREQREGLQLRMDELARTKERLGTAIAATTDGLWCWTIQQRDVWYSDKFWQLLGYNKSSGFPDATYRSFLKHLHPDDRQGLKAALRKHFSDRFPLDVEVRLLHVEGVYCWVRIQGSTSYGADRQPLDLAGTIEDIHERKVAQLQLSKSEQLLLRVGQVAKIGGWSYDIATWELVLSEETLRIHDLPADASFTLENTIEFYAPEAQPIIRQAVQRGIERGESWDLELPFQTAQGRHLWVRAQGEAEFVNGQPARLFGSFQDITSRKVAEAEFHRLQLEESKVRAHLEGVINSATEIAIIATDPQGMITLFSPGAERLLGYTASEMVGLQTPAAIHLPEEIEQRAAEMSEQSGRPISGFEVFVLAAREGKFDRREWTYVSKNGEHRIVDLTITAIRDQMQNLEGFLGIAIDVTEKKKNEKQLERLANVASRTTNMVVITDAQGRIEWVNAGFTRTSGYELQEVLGKKPGVFLQGEKTDQAEVQRISGLLKRGLGFTSEILNYRKNGDPYWLHTKVDPIHDPQGKLTGFMAIQSDITSRKQTEMELRESREQMRRLLEVLPAAAYTCDDSGMITYFNRAAAEMWGREPVLNHPSDRYCGSYQLYDKDNHPLTTSECAMAIALRENRMIHGAEMVIECEDGARRTALAHANPLYNGAGKIVGGVNVLVDISERIALENSLREATARLELCLKILDKHSIVAETELNGTIRHVNDYFCEISGYVRAEILGKTHQIINSGYHPTGMWKDVFRTIAETGMWQGEVCNRRKNGELYWVDTTIATMHNGQGKASGYFVIRNDITELKAAKEAALAASRSKSEFLANMSHEIRTPLTAILGYAELLQDDNEIHNSPEKRELAIKTIREAGQHLLTVINDILDLSKIEAGKMSIETVQTDLAGIFHQVESLFRPRAAGKGVTLQTDLATPIPSHILSDPTRLRQILMNLVGNAVKFTEHGTVRIIVRFLPSPESLLQIDIEDTGRGMSSEHQQRLFQAFEQVDTSVTRQHGGTGLGLVICRRLARLMQGEVTLINSAMGQGTSIRVELPCHPTEQAVSVTEFQPKLLTYQPSQLPTTADTGMPAATQNNTHASEASDSSQASTISAIPAAPLPPARILLAEDGPDNQRLISFMLRKLGLQVEIAENGRIALERLLQHPPEQPQFDLLLTDMQMPELDGYSLARALREQGYQLPIIALTAHAMAEDRQKCTDAGCDDYLTKPVNRQQLAEVIGNWLNKIAQANSHI